MPFSILIVEDNPETAKFLEKTLIQEGYNTHIASSVYLAKMHVIHSSVDLVLLDVNLEELSGEVNISAINLIRDNIVGQEGYELAAWLRASHQEIRVMFLTSRDSVADRVRGLDVGGDDFISKPFAPDELKARIRAIVRRSDKREDRVEFFNGWKLNVRLCELSHVTRPELKPISITSAELKILLELLNARGKTVSREILSKRAYGRPLMPQDRAVDTAVSKIRSKMNDETGSINSIIETMHGSGYRLVRR